MQFNAQSCSALTELQKHWVCLYNQSPANPHDYRNSTLAHALSPWQSDTDSPPASVSLCAYDLNWCICVFEGPRAIVCLCSWIMLKQKRSSSRYWGSRAVIRFVKLCIIIIIIWLHLTWKTHVWKVLHKVSVTILMNINYWFSIYTQCKQGSFSV